MITLKHLTIRNFLSVGQVTQAIDLTAAGLTLVLGRNADIGAANARNGVGKTTLAQAISYVLFGEPLANIRLGNLVNNINQKSMLVTLDFERDGRSYRIERGRKPNILRFLVNDQPVDEAASAQIASAQTNGAQIGETDDAQGENRHTQGEIDRVLAMSHLLFAHLVTLNTQTEPFLRMKPAQAREVIEELLGITQISLRDEALQKLIKASKDLIREEEAGIKANTEANARINRAIDRAREEAQSWRIAQQARIAELTREMKAIAQIDFEAESAIFDRADAWVATQRELTAERALQLGQQQTLIREASRLEAEITRKRQAAVLDHDTQIARLQAERARCQSEAGKTPQAQLARLHEEAARAERDALSRRQAAAASARDLAVVQAEMAAADGHVCATCGQDLAGTDHLASVLQALALRAEKLDQEVKRGHQEAALRQAQAIDIYQEIEQIGQAAAERAREWLDKAEQVRAEIDLLQIQQQTQRAVTADALAELERDLAGLAQRLAEQVSALAEIDAALTGLGPCPVSRYRSREAIWQLRQAQERLATDIQHAKDAPNPHEAQIASLQATIHPIDYARLNEAQSLLLHQEFLHRLLSGKDSFIRKRIVDQTLGYLNSRMNRYLDALGLPHEIQFKPDLSADITILGRELDFEQLSRGEMNRVILANCWSFRDVWESTNTGLNLCIVDELIDSGMDDNGAENALEILSAMARERARNVFLISHRDSLIGRVNRILLVHKENQFTRFEADANP